MDHRIEGKLAQEWLTTIKIQVYNVFDVFL